MAKAKTKTETVVATSLLNAVSASFTLEAAEGFDVEAVGGVIYKGEVSGKQGVQFQAVINGKMGEVKANAKPAINDALKAANMNPASYLVPEKWTDIAPKANKPEAPKTLADLPKEDQEVFNASYTELKDALEADDAAVDNRRAVNFRLAGVVLSVRSKFKNKETWKQFQSFAPSAALKDFLGKNTVGEFCKAGRILQTEGFDADVMVAERVSGAKGVVSAYQSVINAVAANAVTIIRSEGGRKALKLGKKSDTAALRVVIEDMLERGVFSLTEAGSQVELSEAQIAMAKVVIPLHYAKWGEDIVVMFEHDSESGTFSPAKYDKSKQFLAETTFGLEGADEFVSALAKYLSTYLARTEGAAAADSTAKLIDPMVKKAKALNAPFAAWPQADAARHLLNILMSRYDEDGSEDERAEQAADINGIIDIMSDLLDKLFAEEMTKADILSGDAPESEEDAEDAADAAAA